MSALSAVLLIFSFQLGSSFFHVGQPGRTGAYLLYPIPDIGRCRKFGWITCITQRNDLELILTVKMEVKHPIEGSFGSEFSAICNYRGITASCVISKLFEHCLMNKYGSYLYSNDLQFGF